MLREDKADTYKQQNIHISYILVDDVSFNDIFSIKTKTKTCKILYCLHNLLKMYLFKIVPICSMAKWEQKFTNNSCV